MLAVKPRKQISSIRVGFRVLHVLEAENASLSLKELAARAGMSPSKTHGYVASFLDEGIMRQDPATGAYGLGPFAMQLGAAAMRQFNVVELAREVANQLRDASQCSVFLSIWGNRGPTIVHKVDGPSPLTIRIGHVLSLLTSASGHLFLAFLPGDETQALLAAELAALGAKDKPDLGPILRRVKADHLAGQEKGTPYIALSAPVFRHDGQLAASLNITRPSEIVEPKERRQLGILVRNAALEISAKFGYQKGSWTR